MKGILFVTLLSSSLLAGCVGLEPQNIIVVAPDTYVLSAIADPGNLSVNGIKAVMLQKAESFCQSQGRQMQQIVNLSRENAIGVYATPDMQFKCITARQ